MRTNKKTGRRPREAGERSVVLTISVTESEARMIRKQAESFGGLSKFMRFIWSQYNRHLFEI